MECVHFQTLLCFSTPNTHPYISDAEKKFLNENVDALKGNQQVKDPVPWKALLRSVPLWALIIAAVSTKFFDDYLYKHRLNNLQRSFSLLRFPF